MDSRTIDLGEFRWQMRGYWPCEWEMAGDASFPFLERAVTSWIETEVPGSVTRSLLDQNIIDDPYRGMNSLACEWIWQRDWVYRCRFRLDRSLRRSNARLRFEGVDYACVVGMNGRRLGEHEGMFSPFEFDVSDLVRWDEENELWIAIRQAPHEVSQIGRSYEVSTVKTRVTYKWDFATRLVNLGIWNPVKMHLFDRVRITDLNVRTRPEGTRWRVEVRAEIDAVEPGEYDLAFQLSRSGGIAGEPGFSDGWKENLSGGSQTIEKDFVIGVDPADLWWPHTLGEPVLHDAKLLISAGGSPATEETRTIGFRDLRFEPVPGGPPDAPGYLPVINGRRTCILGFNWVPIDHMYGPEYRDRHDQMTDRVVDCGANMLRIWGGGLIEKDILYDLCDRKGILIWQDFIQSSSGASNRPPRDPEYLELLKREMVPAIRRVRNHPSLAVWCGGNELTGENHVPLTDSEPLIGLLKGLVDEHDPGRHFLDTNPTGKISGLTMDAVESGEPLWDIHGPWQYQGDPGQYELFNRNTAIFHSEFGAVGTANLKTLRFIASDQELWKPHGEHPLWLHHGAWWIHTDQVGPFFGGVPDLETFVESSQFLQAEAVRYAAEANRRRYPAFGGMLFWQFNEPWPNSACTNHVDYFGRPKMSYYFIRRAYEEVLVSLRYASLRPRDGAHEVDCFVSNLSEAAFNRPVHARVIDSAGAVVAEKTFSGVRMNPGESGSLGTFRFGAGEPDSVLFCRAEVEGGNPSSAKTYVFSSDLEHPFRPLWSLLKTRLAVSPGEGGRITLSNEGSSVAFLARIEAADPSILLLPEDNFLTLAPGESASLEIRPRLVHGSSIEPSGLTLTARAWNADQVQFTVNGG